jgi:recombination protein RecR
VGLIDELISSLQVLPGVGPKSAQRIALQVLQRDQKGGQRLSNALREAIEKVGRCQRCRNLTELEICQICTDERRDRSLLCVVESPADVLAIDFAGGFKGTYFVLNGRLSPIEGIGPKELEIDRLESLVYSESLKEVVIATNPTMEGEATATYIAGVLQDKVGLISRIAHGVPLGGEIEYTDGGTLSHAIARRRDLSRMD